VGEAAVSGNSPWGQGSYGTHPNTSSPWGQGSYGTHPNTSSPWGQGSYGIMRHHLSWANCRACKLRHGRGRYGIGGALGAVYNTRDQEP
jgi:hypothetical protein